jgi:hypothetical protein
MPSVFVSNISKGGGDGFSFSGLFWVLIFLVQFLYLLTFVFRGTHPESSSFGKCMRESGIPHRFEYWNYAN